MPARKPSTPSRARPAASRRERRHPAAAIASGVGLALAATGRAAGLLLLAGGRALAARPVLYAGCAAFLATGAAVTTNAVRNQEMQHPHPMLATRVLEAVPGLTQAQGVAAGPQPWRPVNDPRIMSVPLVREVQVLLAAGGYYQAEVDGRPGQATDRAIRTFQAERGLRVDGMATPLLLAQIRQHMGAAPAPATAPAGREYAGLDDLMSDLQSDAYPDIPILDEEPADPALVKGIQQRLADARVADLKADGIMGSRTRAAIRSFQELDGMAVTGEPTPALLERLEMLAANR